MAFDPGAWDYGKWGASGYGAVDIAEARKAGATTYNLWALKDRAEKHGLAVGPKVDSEIGEARPNAPVDYGKHGYWGFGMEDMKHLGHDLDKIKEARQWAWDHGVQVGPKVAPWIQEKEDERRLAAIEQGNRDRIGEIKAGNEELAAIQQKAADDQAALMEQLHAEEQRRWEEDAYRAARIKSSSPTGVGGAASIKGSRLSITKGGPKKGPRQFARPLQHMNVLGMAPLDPRAIQIRTPDQVPITL